MGTVIGQKVVDTTKTTCIEITAETYKCIEISSFVPTCINIISSIPSEPTPPYDPWERPEQEPSEAPVLTSLETCVADGDTIGVLIENFDENALYVNLRATNEFLSPPYLYGDTIVWTFDNDIECGETETVSIQVIQMDKTISPVGSYSVVGKCKLDTPILSGSSLVDEYSTVIITIDNYNASYVYEISDVTVGTAEIVGSTIEWFIPRVISTVTGGTIKVIATSPTEPCKITSDEGQHTINITQDGKTGTVKVEILYTVYKAEGVRRYVTVGGVLVFNQIIAYSTACSVPDPFTSGTHVWSYSYDTESYTIVNDPQSTYIGCSLYMTAANDNSPEWATPFL